MYESWLNVVQNLERILLNSTLNLSGDQPNFSLRLANYVKQYAIVARKVRRELRIRDTAARRINCERVH